MKKVSLLFAAIVLCANLCTAETFETVEIDTSSAESGAVVFGVTNGVPAVTMEESGLVCAMAVDATEGYSISGEMLAVEHLADGDKVALTNQPLTASCVWTISAMIGSAIRAIGPSGLVLLTENDRPGIFIKDGLDYDVMVGINTFSPAYTLEVAGDIGASVVETGRLETPYVQALDNGGIEFRDQDGDLIGIWTNAGDLGIGTDSPDEALDVRGNITTTGTLKVSGPSELGGISKIRGTETYTGLVYPDDTVYVIDGLIVY